MDIRVRILCLLVGIATFILTVVNVRRRRLNEDFAVFWFILSLFMLTFSMRFDLIEKASHFLGVLNPNNFVFFLGTVFAIFISLYFSIRISRIEKYLTIMVQKRAVSKESGADKK